MGRPISDVKRIYEGVFMSLNSKKSSSSVTTCGWKKFRAGAISACSVVALLSAEGAVAQEISSQSGAPADDSTQSRQETVVVTARKREERLQDVPVSISAVTSFDIEKAGLRRLQDIAIPNFVFDDQLLPGAPQVSIRGIFQTVYLPGFDPAYSVYVDDIYVGRAQSLVNNIDTADIERIEVLRGPQGTLSGKNSIAGAINVVTKKPTNEFEGYVSGEIGDYNLLDFRAGVNVPVIKDKLAARFSFRGAERDGYAKYINFENDTGAGNISQRGARAQLLFTPTERLSVLLSGQYFTDDANSYELDVSAPIGDGIPFTLETEFPSRTDITNRAGVLKVDYELENDFSITSVTGWRRDSRFNERDSDHGTTFGPIHYNIDVESEQWSQEVRLNSPQYEAFDFVAGLYYFDEDLAYVEDDFDVFGFNLLALQDISVESFGIFGHVNFNLTDKLTAFAGARYTDERKKTEVNLTGTGQAAFGYIPGFEDSIEYGEPSWTAGLRYKYAPNTMLYTSVSRGFKSGGFALGVNASRADNTSVLPEFATSYEAGLKTGLFGGRASLNTAVFYTDYSDLQVIVLEPNPVDPAASIGRLRNAAAIESKGVEIEFSGAITDQLDVSLGIGYVDSKFEDFPNFNGIGSNAAGQRVGYTPEWTINAGIDHEWPLPALGGSIVTHIDYRYFDERYSAEDGGKNLETNLVPSYDQLNGRIGFELDKGDWGVYLWGRNLTDELGSTATAAFRGGPSTASHYIEPRTFGVGLNYTF